MYAFHFRYRHGFICRQRHTDAIIIMQIRLICQCWIDCSVAILSTSSNRSHLDARDLMVSGKASSITLRSRRLHHH